MKLLMLTSSACLHIVQVMKKMTEANMRDAIKEEWKEFEQLCPRNDDVQEWCLDHPLHIPFRNILFGGTRIENSFYLFAITLTYLIAGA